MLDELMGRNRNANPNEKVLSDIHTWRIIGSFICFHDTKRLLLFLKNVPVHSEKKLVWLFKLEQFSTQNTLVLHQKEGIHFCLVATCEKTKL